MQRPLRLCIIVYIASLTTIIIAAWRDSEIGVNQFAKQLRARASRIQPWEDWNVVVLDADSKLNFYLRLDPTTKPYAITRDKRDEQTQASLKAAWPILINKPANTIFLSRTQYADLLAENFKEYDLFTLDTGNSLFQKDHDGSEPIGYIPK